MALCAQVAWPYCCSAGLAGPDSELSPPWPGALVTANANDTCDAHLPSPGTVSSRYAVPCAAFCSSRGGILRWWWRRSRFVGPSATDCGTCGSEGRTLRWEMPHFAGEGAAGRSTAFQPRYETGGQGPGVGTAVSLLPQDCHGLLVWRVEWMPIKVQAHCFGVWVWQCLRFQTFV